MGEAYSIVYALQDDVLRVLSALDTEFYLTGGTAASRGYLHHRFSEDLDLFVNDDPRFRLWSERVIDGLAKEEWLTCEVLLREARFGRLEVVRGQSALRIELVNDVPSRVGDVRQHSVLGRLDSPENILANKITAVLDRQEPKDLADIWGFCSLMQLSIAEAISGAQGKAAGVFPPDLGRVLCSASLEDYEIIRWTTPPTSERFLSDLQTLGEQLLLGPQGTRRGPSDL